MKLGTAWLLIAFVWVGVACDSTAESTKGPGGVYLPIVGSGPRSGTLQPYPPPGSAATRAPAAASTSAPTAAPSPIIVQPTATRPATPLAAEPTPRRLTLTLGAAATKIQSNLAANGIARYTVRAEAKQRLAVRVTSAQANMLFSVSGADGQVLKSSGVAASNWNMAVPSSQDYFIAVSSQQGKATAYTLELSLQKP